MSDYSKWLYSEVTTVIAYTMSDYISEYTVSNYTVCGILWGKNMDNYTVSIQWVIIRCVIVQWLNVHRMYIGNYTVCDYIVNDCPLSFCMVSDSVKKKKKKCMIIQWLQIIQHLIQCDYTVIDYTVDGCAVGDYTLCDYIQISDVKMILKNL